MRRLVPALLPLFLVAAWSVIIVCTGYCFLKLLLSDRDFSDGE